MHGHLEEGLDGCPGAKEGSSRGSHHLVSAEALKGLTQEEELRRDASSEM